MSHDVYLVDSFTDEAFRGNPAGVCFLGSNVPEDWMQGIAAEVNASETAFLTPSDSVWRIRYYTPQVEVPLCGHATLASAHVLWETGRIEASADVAFSAQAGELRASLEDGWIKLDFPASVAEPFERRVDWQAIIGATPREVLYHPESGHLLRLDNARAVRQLEPDFAAMVAAGMGYVIATAASDDGRFDFVSRFFAPSVGINEDPVTGVAHTSLGPYWAQRCGKTEVVGFQASRRGGVVRVRPRQERVEILGQAVTVIRGQILT